MPKFKSNDRVMARWPGSSLWFEGTVIDLNDIAYQIRFNDPGQSEFVIKYKDVKTAANFRTRSKSRGRSESRGRTGRRKSPGRRSAPISEPEPVKVAKPKVEVKKVTESVVEHRNDIFESVTFSRLSRADLASLRTSTPTRQSLRTAYMNEKIEYDGQFNNVEAFNTSKKLEPAPVPTAASAPTAASVSVSAPVPKSLGTHSDLPHSRGSGVKSGIIALVPSLATVRAFILTIVVIVLPVIHTEMCTKSKCTVMEFPAIPRKLQLYYDPLAVAIVAGFLVAQLLLYLIPLGKVVKTRSGTTVRCNGLIALLVTIAVVPTAVYFGYDVLQVYSKYRQLLATCIVLGVVLSLAMYVRAKFIPDDAKNPVGNSGSFFPDFLTGCEVNPVVKSVDLKFFLVRAMHLAWIVINMIVVVKDLQAKPGVYSPTLLLACALQIFFAMDFVWFGETYLTTYDYMRQGCGLFFIVLNLTMPFMLPIFTRLVLNHRTEFEWYYLAMIATLYLVGYTIVRGSDSQKHAFRTNPSNPALAHLESVPTAAGTRLLVSGWWGVARHPNYLGNILIFIAFAALCGFTYALPWILVGLDTLFLVGRVYEVESACKKKYGRAWDSYTDRVKYRLIPKVF
ncbi:delta(14)-sterol reductase TM7SF2 isoform X2 [Procambarus clarkii]|nr:delta(14)-sterol reductase TM7SF2-like isoform X2 [Procambarus clarkii]